MIHFTPLELDKAKGKGVRYSQQLNKVRLLVSSLERYAPSYDGGCAVGILTRLLTSSLTPSREVR